MMRDDPSVFVRMPLVDHAGYLLLVWTTTPWTLPANVAVAAHPDVDYVTVERELPEGGKERLILAEALVRKSLWRRTGQGRGTFQGQAAERQTLPASVYLYAARQTGSLCGHGRFCDHRRWHRSGAYRPGLWRGRYAGGAWKRICR